MKHRPVWFKAKEHGYGWYPATWQAWIITALFTCALTWRAITVASMFDTITSFLLRYIFEVLFLTIPLLVICYLFGEKPGWRWGKK